MYLELQESKTFYAGKRNRDQAAELSNDQSSFILNVKVRKFALFSIFFFFSKKSASKEIIIKGVWLTGTTNQYG